MSLFETNIQLRRSIWRSFVKEKLANQKERQLAAKVVNTTKKYFGMVTGSGDVLVKTRVLSRKMEKKYEENISTWE